MNEYYNSAAARARAGTKTFSWHNLRLQPRAIGRHGIPRSPGRPVPPYGIERRDGGASAVLARQMNESWIYSAARFQPGLEQERHADHSESRTRAIGLPSWNSKHSDNLVHHGG